MSSDEESVTIWINSTRDRQNYGPACHIVWEELEWYASVDEVRSTALQLVWCAAYGDMIAELFKIGLPREMIAALVGGMLSHSEAVAEMAPKHQTLDTLGSKHTLKLMPAGSTKHQAGAVRLMRGNKTLDISPADAVRMAGHWLAAAEASESDTLFSQVVERSGLLSEFDNDALFGLLSDIRSGQASVPPARQ